LQVLAGFLGTAYLAVVVVVGFYLLAFDPEKDPFELGGDAIFNRDSLWRPNQVDKLLLKFVRHRIFKVRRALANPLKQRLEKAFNDVSLFLHFRAGVLASPLPGTNRREVNCSAF